MTKQTAAAGTSTSTGHTDPFSRKYKILSKIGEGSYSEVLKCKNRETGAIYACKRLKHCYRSWNQVNDIPEIVTLKKLARHPNILQMVEIHFDPTAGRVSLVFELMDMNLYELIKDRKRLLPESRVRVMMFQLMRALRHLHKHGIFHRDIKPENILLRNDLLKLGDLGSVRGLYSRPPYTEYISTRWYRSPECLLTCGYYSFKMDVWAAGCVFYEILTLRPLFPGSSELDQINRVHNVLGPPPNKILQKFSKHAEIERDYSRHTSKQARQYTIKRVLGEMKNSSYEWYFTGKEAKGVDQLLPTHVTADAKDLLKHLLQYDPDSRPSSHRALQHNYFKELREQAQRAVQDKPPPISGVIVTIVGEEGGGGVEVTPTDVNANPADLSTLADAKLKVKAPPKRGSDMKENSSLTCSKSKSLRKGSSDNLSMSYNMSPTTTTTNNRLKEAGEMFISGREPPLEETESSSKKLISNPSTNNYEPRRTEERVKLVQRTMANLRFGGDVAVSPSSRQQQKQKQQHQEQSPPYPKMYLHGTDEDDGDGPNQNVIGFTTGGALEEKRNKHGTAATAFAVAASSNLNRRRGESKMRQVERKKSLTIMSQESSTTGRGYPLDFIDKTSITPDVLVRINENRRIAHMQPIVRTELKKAGRDNKSPPAITSQPITTTINNNNKNLHHHYNNNNGATTHKQVRELLTSLPTKLKRSSDASTDHHHQAPVESRTVKAIQNSYSKSNVEKQGVESNHHSSRHKYETDSNAIPNHHHHHQNNKKIYFDHEADLKTILESSNGKGEKKSQWTSGRQNQQQQQKQDNLINLKSSYDTTVHSFSPKSKGYAMEDASYDSVSSSLSPTNIRRVIENRRRAELATTDTDGDGDTYNNNNNIYGKTSVVHRKLDSSRRKRRSRFSTDSNTSRSRLQHLNNNNDIKNTNISDPVAPKNVSDSPRPLIHHHQHQHQHQHGAGAGVSSTTTKDGTISTPRISAAVVAVQATRQHSISGSSANKQVREILAEMRKRRDLLQEKVTKDPTLQNWKAKTRSGKDKDKDLPTNSKNANSTTTTNTNSIHHHGSSYSSNTTTTATIHQNNIIPIKAKSKLSESALKKQPYLNVPATTATTQSVESSGRRDHDHHHHYNIINNSNNNNNNEHHHNNNNNYNHSSYTGSTTYRFNHGSNNNITSNKYEYSGTNTSSTNRSKPTTIINRHSNKLGSNSSSTARRRQAEEQQQQALKIGRQPSVVKYLESEPRLKGTIKSSTDNSKNNNIHHTSQAFPRNRYGTHLHR